MSASAEPVGFGSLDTQVLDPSATATPVQSAPAANLTFDNTEPAALDAVSDGMGDDFPTSAAPNAPWADPVAPAPALETPAAALGDDGDAQGQWLVEPPSWSPSYPVGPLQDEPVAPPQEADVSGWSAWEAPPAAVDLHASAAAPAQDSAAAQAAPEPFAPAQDDFLAELARFAAASARPPAPEEPPAPPVPTQTVHGFSEPDEVAARQAVLDALDAAPVAVHAAEPVDPADEADEPGFMRQARRQAFWHTPGVRAAMALVVLLLGVLLAGQWAVHERDRLAASQPELAPWLAQLCQPLGCSIGPLRHIDAVVIDSSTLARRLGNFYAFDVVLKNTSGMPVALPALELSLTDTRDQVIARRVFLSQDLPGAPALLPAQASVPLSLRLAITDVGAVPMAGYRALVFYP